MKICVSIAPRSMDEAISKLRVAGKKAELVEVRIDGCIGINLERLLRKPRPKVIITNRRAGEGGSFTGSVDEQRKILSRALELGAEYVDMELSWGHEPVREFTQMRRNVIASYHNFRETPEDLSSIYQELRGIGAGIIKIATMANDIADNNRIAGIVSRAKSERQKVIGFCMGERGQISRILTGAKRGFLTYASLSNEECTAPGQLTVEELLKTYRAGSLSSRTRIFGLVGNPVSQSKGVFFHNDIFRRRRTNAVYLNFLVDNLAAFLEAFRGELKGISVTMPFKQEVIPFLDAIDQNAARLGVVNTVLFKRGKLRGYNTDLPAIVSLLRKKTALRGKRVTILGTGGMAKTMAYAAISQGTEVQIVGRSESKARLLAAGLGCEHTTFENIHTLRSDVLMNGTSGGMFDRSEHPLVPQSVFRRGMIVLDAVYQPVMTPLLKSASARGCEIITGMELFKRQARMQSKLFFQVMR